eukprot:Awhi_evm1s218
MCTLVFGVLSSLGFLREQQPYQPYLIDHSQCIYSPKPPLPIKEDVFSTKRMTGRWFVLFQTRLQRVHSLNKCFTVDLVKVDDKRFERTFHQENPSGVHTVEHGKKN